jgi:hypothetical protein
MNEQDKQATEAFSRVNRRVQEIAQREPDGRELSAIVAGTSEETAALFGSEPTLIPYQE